MEMYENPPYYLSAYALACKRGFRGNLDEWLESLNGKTAYQVAVEQGFQGSEAEWLKSLIGPPGPEGPPGALIPLETGNFVMTISESGHLLLCVNEGDPAPPLEINGAGHLVYKINT